MKKFSFRSILTVLFALLCVGNVWGEATTVFSWNMSGTSAPALDATLTTNLTAKSTDSGKSFAVESASYNTNVTDDMKATDGKGLKVGSNALYLELTGTFQSGDVVYICGYNPWKISSSTDMEGDIASSISTGTSKSDYNVKTYTLTTDAGTLIFSRAEATGTAISAIKIVRGITVVDCPATEPGEISKGTKGNPLTLTAAGSPAANNTWYWQTTADGTSTENAGTTFEVTVAGTYYIRSYYSEDDGCWSSAKSITVTEADLQAAIDGNQPGLSMYFVNSEDAAAYSITNTDRFTGVPTGSQSLSGSISIGSITYNVTQRSSNGSHSISFSIPSGKIATLYVLGNSSGSGTRNLLLAKDEGTATATGAGVTGSSSLTAATISNLTAGDYVLTASGNWGLGMIALLESDVVSVSAVGYATFFDSEHAYTMPADMEGYAWNDGLVKAYDAAAVVPAGTALVLKAAEGTYTLAYTTGGTAPAANALLGTDTETALTADADSYFYGLSLNAAGETSSVGFYWMNETGEAFTNGAHKAYLKLAKSSAPGAPTRFLFNETEVTTEIENVAAETEVRKALINGQIMVIRGEKMFDLNGRLVK